jgi:hypothetical protein
MQIGAKDWAKHDRVRQKLADCFDGMQREERIRVMRDRWRGEVSSSGSKRGASGKGLGWDGDGEVGC